MIEHKGVFYTLVPSDGSGICGGCVFRGKDAMGLCQVVDEETIDCGNNEVFKRVEIEDLIREVNKEKEDE